MNVDLTSRDIELILTLLAESASDEMYFMSSSLYSVSEIALLEKLEAALKKCAQTEKSILDADSSGFCH